MGPPRTRRLLLIAASAVVAVVAVAVLASALREPSALERARASLKDTAAFETGLGAGETLARVAQHLEEAVGACRSDDRGVACPSLSSALGYAQVLASVVLTCTAPGREEARTRMLTYLDEVAAVAPEDARVPEPPRLPSCA